MVKELILLVFNTTINQQEQPIRGNLVSRIDGELTITDKGSNGIAIIEDLGIVTWQKYETDVYPGCTNEVNESWYQNESGIGSEIVVGTYQFTVVFPIWNAMNEKQ